VIEKTKIRRRYARPLGKRDLVIDATEQEIALVKQGKLGLEKVKSTPRYEVYRIKR
jgi:hypothetical protein